MKIIVFSFLAFNVFFCAIAQENRNDLYNYSNSLKYARYLMKTRQYAQAVIELERMHFMEPDNDSLTLALVRTYRISEKFELGIAKINALIEKNRQLSEELAREYVGMNLLAGKSANAAGFLQEKTFFNNKDRHFYKLNLFLFEKEWQPALEYYNYYCTNLLNGYDGLFSKIRDSRYKKPWLAMSMSAIVPGTGKIYTGDWKDAIMSMITIGALSWQAYRGFDKGGINSAYGWIFGGLSLGFYSGNVFGSYKAAQTYNNKLDDEIFEKARHLFVSSF